jgi:energy-coupling factor transporter transmembrane protein EcfT
MIEGGLFLMMNAISVIFMIANIKYKEYFYVIPMFLFLVLGLWLMQGETVAFEITTTDGVTQINQTSYLIGNPDTAIGAVFSIHTPWLGVGYVLGAIIMGFVVFLGLTDHKAPPGKRP